MEAKTSQQHSKPGTVYRFMGAIRNITPFIWRDFSIDAGDSLAHLHRALQILFGWNEYHLYEFVIKGMEFSEVDDDSRSTIDPVGVMLQDLRLTVGDTFLYRYDFGDNWEVDLRLTDVTERPQGTVFPRCHDGRRAGPPEDCGGTGGYAELLRVLGDHCDEEHERMREWVGPHVV